MCGLDRADVLGILLSAAADRTNIKFKLAHYRLKRSVDMTKFVMPHCDLDESLMRQRVDQSTPRVARLQAIRDRWFSESLRARFPALTDDPSTHQLPTTCHEFVTGTRVNSAFSSLHENPEMTGMSHDEALAHDRSTNFQRFGAEDPASLLQELSRQLDRAPGGQVDPESLKKGYTLLDELRSSSLELVDQFRSDPTAGVAADDPMKRMMRESYLADADALAQAQGIIHELAGELGISLPLNRGFQRGD